MTEPFDIRVESDRVCLLASLISELPLERVIEEIGSADAIGPLIDPTAYRDMLYRKEGNMHDVLKIAQAMLPVKKVTLELKKKLNVQ